MTEQHIAKARVEVDAPAERVWEALTGTDLIAQWMMARKILQNWLVWVAVDVVYIGMFLFKSLTLTAVLYAVFLVLSAMGYFQWKKSLESDAARAAA